ncbi:hypothetical protein [Fundidesulfovibrio soli]|uniref:hypothetical protein n=1 Tax=Fundidesulfovibrio soli TaxID=2922716 RepID=UPI001FAF14C1|nr:hypothetical protein [Fundidesulfovibrio soli]
MTIQDFVSNYNGNGRGVSGTYPANYSYDANIVGVDKLEAICNVDSKPNVTGFRTLDPWFMYFVSALECETNKNVGKICVKFNYEEDNVCNMRSLGRRLFYLAENNGWELDFMSAYGNKIELSNGLERESNEIIRVDYNDPGDNKENGRTEKDFQTFLFASSLAAQREGHNTNERLAIFGPDFFNLKKKKYPIAREFSTGAFAGEKAQANRILPTYFIDFVTINKYGQLSIIEFKLNDKKMECMAQILDYALFVLIHKKSFIDNLRGPFKSNVKEDGDFVCYIASNAFHKRFSEIEKYYAPNKENKFGFHFKKILLGYTSAFEEK